MANDKAPGNPLFSPANTIQFTTNALLMPVQEQSPAIFSSDTSAEDEASFLGDNVNIIGQHHENVATFTMFSQKSDSLSTDPFACIAPTSLPRDSVMQSKPSVPITTGQQEPQLFVPSSPGLSPQLDNHSSINPSQSSIVDEVEPPHPPPAALDSAHANPYSRQALAGHRPRAMFPTNTSIVQNTLPINSPSTMQHVGHESMIFPPPHTMGHPQPKLVNETTFSSNLSMPVPGNTAPPVVPHWFYSKQLTEINILWCPFSNEDSRSLESAYQTGSAATDTIITDGGRYDVSIAQRERCSVYWEEPHSTVRRCSWFCKADNEHLYSPYEEAIADKLEKEYQNIVKNGLWHKRIELPHGEAVIVHNPQLIVHFQPVPHKDGFGSTHENQPQTKIVKRGIYSTDFAKEIPESESGLPDHIIFVCHGVGPVCDLRSRSIVECVDDFRSIHLKLLQSHFKDAAESKKAKRIEFLPVHWHQALHGDATGVDRNIRHLTLPSISRLRHFTNETLLDILFYSSPVYCQTIAETVGNEINALYDRFLTRNPTFSGRVSLIGHSLGSLILFDLLSHQTTSDNSKNIPQNESFDTSFSQSSSDLPKQSNGAIEISQASHDKEEVITLESLLQKLNLESFQQNFEAEQIDMDALVMCTESDFKDIGLPLGPRKKLLSFLKQKQEKEKNYQEQEQIQQSVFAALKEDNTQSIPSKAEEEFDAGNFLSFATNVHVDFQQFDSGTGQPAVCYPKLDFSPQVLFALGSPIGMFLTVRGIAELGEDFFLPTCQNFINVFHPFDPVAYRIEPLINPECNLKPVQVPHYKGRKRLHLELKESLGRMGQELKQGIMRSVRLAIGSMQKFAQSHWSQAQQNAEVEEEVKSMTEQIISEQQSHTVDADETASAASDSILEDMGFGKLNDGKRIDYVLQERPLESFNDYLFAFQSHLCYWNSEDTVLLMMKEIYGAIGVLSDNQLSKQALRVAPTTGVSSSYSQKS
ncbi:triacylglycerol hydrolase DDHD2-like isoform X2 [Clavelina lepadiformis]|uniref:triacylglycerol hydrolase DDHD2-like isoform X2 n=1 Tax=Clavelina lepadiformis TaxID=159417 RepID=UPI0040412348